MDNNIIELLSDLEDYFEGMADADHDGDKFVPNEEMNFLCHVREAIESEENKSDIVLPLQLQNSILLNALKEIAVPYPEQKGKLFNDKDLCIYLINTAQIAIQSIEVGNLIDKSKNLKK